MGRTKQLLPLGDRALLEWPLSAMRAFAPATIILVLGHEAPTIQASLDLSGAVVVVNDHYAEGQSTSLRAGLRAVPAGVNATVLATGDQPFINAEHLKCLADAWRATGAPIVATDYGDHHGVPILLARAVWPLAEAVEGDQGARALLRGQAGRIATVPAADALMGLDIDTEQGYAAALTALGAGAT
jgi:molybdenum cofactor cytidylyltransferase